MAELKTFVFTDISGSVRLKDEMSGRSVTERDMAFINSILTPHRQRIEADLEQYGGRVVSTAGDGHFLVFEHTVGAAQWAVAVQKSHQDDPIDTPKGEHVEVRMSMHVGVPQIDPGDRDNFVGKTVDYAARLNDYATGGQILVSRSVMAILDDVGLEDVRLHLHGRKGLKGIGSVEIHELLYDDHGPRPMRNQPKTNAERQWTVVPTQGFERSTSGGSVSVAGQTALKRVGNYELEQVIGSGGMGDVYKAHHTQFGRVRAVKVIKSQYVGAGHEDVVRRFYNEIKAVGRLEHKNIVVAIDSSAPADKVHYLVMEFIEGVSLDEMVTRHGPLPVPEASEIIRQAARGLQYIHKHEMVHRDIKPSNLMVTLVDADQISGDSTVADADDGERAVVKILDLGLALLADDNHDRLTRLDHKAMGTGMYMPPEQWRTTTVDIRADVYSLGCTLYHLLAGNPPFFDSDLRPEKAHEKSAVPPIRNAMQPLPRKLWDVLQKMLAKRPEDRYATPAEVAAALAPFAEGHQLAALVRGLEGDQTVSNALTPTKPNGHSKADTWRSRPWFNSDRFRPDRRIIFTKLLPLLLLAGVALGAVWLIQKTQREQQEAAIAQRLATQQKNEEDNRDKLSSYAKTAARTVAGELDKRFALLNSEAKDPELIRMVRAIDALPNDQEIAADPAKVEQRDALREELSLWIQKLPHKYGKNLKYDSWFVQDIHGTQVARTPADDSSLYKPYWYRDYFHGLLKDRDKTSEAVREATKPIENEHLSTVYYSTASQFKDLKVAFSVPIRDDGAGAGESSPPASGPGKVIGVLALSINLNDFDVLDPEQARGSEVILIDLRKDWINGENHGLILHHPRLDKGELARVEGDLMKRIDAADPTKAPEFDGSKHFLVGYADPLNKDKNPDQKYWGAFEPIRYEMRTSESDEADTERFGWVVLVQKPMPDDVSPVRVLTPAAPAVPAPATAQ
ncbi:protein kinase domain-containing protein [Lacipirellula sp.]|uniref:protein kinase domain-containing protein n=1 Tax=Lacipirellula sp. TaxID=2691419 RepID=UPI003D0BA1C7